MSGGKGCFGELSGGVGDSSGSETRLLRGLTNTALPASASSLPTASLPASLLKAPLAGELLAALEGTERFGGEKGAGSSAGRTRTVCVVRLRPTTL